jgi:hypothetical protein
MNNDSKATAKYYVPEPSYWPIIGSIPGSGALDSQRRQWPLSIRLWFYPASGDVIWLVR